MQAIVGEVFEALHAEVLSFPRRPLLDRVPVMQLILDQCDVGSCRHLWVMTGIMNKTFEL